MRLLVHVAGTVCPTLTQALPPVVHVYWQELTGGITLLPDWIQQMPEITETLFSGKEGPCNARFLSLPSFQTFKYYSADHK